MSKLYEYYSETMQAKIEWSEIFSVKRKIPPTYNATPCEIILQRGRKVKTFSDEQNWNNLWPVDQPYMKC
jgi:hypothetical protein